MVNWRDAVAGDKLVSDDGVEVTCTKRWQGKDMAALSFSNGTEIRTLWSNLKGFKWHKLTSSKQRNKSRQEKMARIKRFVQVYVASVLAHEEPDWKELGLIANPETPCPEYYSRVVYRNPKTKTMIQEELAKHLSSKGVTEGTVVDLIKDAAEQARTNEDPANMLRAAEDFAEMLDMKPDKAPKHLELGPISEAYFSTVEEQLTAPPPLTISPAIIPDESGEIVYRDGISE